MSILRRSAVLSGLAFAAGPALADEPVVTAPHPWQILMQARAAG